MPVLKCPNGKWRIGTGDCIYDTKESAEAAYRGYLFHKKANAQAFEGKRRPTDQVLREEVEKRKK